MRALLSVFDKDGIVPLATGLRDLGCELISTGGTAKALAAAGLAVREVSDLTGFPEMMDGRVKTLHPRIHGGLLALRDNADHMKQADQHGIQMIDMVVINLYPFEKTARERGDHPAEVIEMIDIGGPSMIRSAAKNHQHVIVLTDPADYERVLEALRGPDGVPAGMKQALAARAFADFPIEMRQALAAKAFAHTAAYDALIADYLAARSGARGYPDKLTLTFRKALDLRYGENPHQKAALYVDPQETLPSAVSAQQLAGKELSFNNILDLDAAWAVTCDFESPACAIIKHTNPAGAALGATSAEAFRRALEADPVSAFGGIVSFNRGVDAEAARGLAGIFLEAVIAPDFNPEALEILASKKNLRLMKTGGVPRLSGGQDYKRVLGGLLVQERDQLTETSASLKTVTKRAPSRDEMESLMFAWTIARHVKSNAIVYARGTVTAGVGAGQMSRVDAVKLGASKAVSPLRGCVLASDAFFPFRDGVDEASRHGIAAIIQPGGSVKDAEVIAAADEHGMAMVFTGRRHFRH